ncbi:MAG: ATP-binding protein, partial [Chloroflexi bacterium]|nr:ATP-binding protein [Chloroflexota bacterium]
VLLFGPPGTGKTTFTRGIAGRLGWLFIEVSRSDLAVEGQEKLPLRLRSLFDLLLQLRQVVVLFDEFEELALRSDLAAPEEKGISYEMLRQLPRLRRASEILLICATNNIRMLNPALLRVGRFDYILPIGPMDAAAREALFRHFLGRMNPGELDFPALAEKAMQFTPADIEAVCAAVAQEAFETELEQGKDFRVGTSQVLRAIEAHRPTISAEDMQRY